MSEEILETLLGRVNLQKSDFSYVDLESKSTGKIFSATIETKRFTDLNIGEDDYFIWRIVSTNDGKQVIISKVEPQILTAEDLHDIMEYAKLLVDGDDLDKL